MSGLTSKKRILYWFSDKESPYTKVRALGLPQELFEVRRVSTVQALLSSFREERSQIILLGPTQLSPGQWEKILQLEDFTGVRLVVVYDVWRKDLIDISLLYPIRDILHVEWSDHEFLSRILFALGLEEHHGKVRDTFWSPKEQALLNVPARIVWMDEKELVLESFVWSGEPGTTLKCTGPLSQQLGLGTMEVMVQSSRKDELHYRFGGQLKGRWHSSAGSPEEILARIEQTLIQNTFVKVFCVLSEPELRTHVQNLSPKNWMFRHALNRQHAYREPPFFSPHVLLMDLAQAQALAQEGHLKVLGQKLPKCLFAVITDETLPASFDASMRAGGAPKMSYYKTHEWDVFVSDVKSRITDEKIAHKAIFPYFHPWTPLWIHVPVTLIKADPDAVVLKSDVSIHPYGWGILKWPYLTRLFGYDVVMKGAPFQNQESQEGRFTGYFVLHPDEDAALQTHNDARVLGTQKGLVAKVLKEESKATMGSLTASVHKTKTYEMDVPIESFAQEPMRPLKKGFQDVVSGMNRSLEGRPTRNSYQSIVVFLFVAAFTMGLLWGFFQVLSTYIKPSGSQYSESLKKFTPGED